MAKYIVESYYTCTFKVKHFVDDISNNQLDQLDKREDGEFEILDVKFDKRNTKSLEKNSLDFYASVKSLYLQDRQQKIRNTKKITNTQNDSDWEEVDN